MGTEMTQEEIDALLSNMAQGDSSESSSSSSPGAASELSQNEIDALLSGDSPVSSSPSRTDNSRNAAQSKPIKQDTRAQSMQFSSFDRQSAYQGKNDIGMILDVPMELTVELGRTTMYIKDILDLGPGSVVEINRLAGEPIELLVNGKVIAKGEVVVIDEKFGLRITELLNPTNEANNN
ncbi:MAG: flagellar motor switch protein FliN [Candidatus Margulisiibacteriota bacterium]|nr:MAG: flagellar motor switch protein FliN [Candidatus Margulisbacteria bacterium GWD2_39_127]OGI05198.1 MAG: flagellar motor switch protein FliN [Candidatus Margulisbacteria bacterium GWF2_38_17]OGI06247.1 MAG: flagellar motor switch protein FliN [Candidatus Margulisbacteria bacterium GWE2_39_32]PZM78903.1 MAG: flagellar motor switch protein FliN [Candidatus Margulisiibacteriota bacterium]HAR64514.1 flagellar motor switch protein FliN [Candidatus Margulisiibacteriota bacterium]